MSFERRVAVIVGGCNGIGREVAIDLASAGADIAVADIDDVSMKSLENDVRLVGRRCLTVSADASNWNEVVALRDKVLERFEKVDILVNTVGGATALARGESRSICNPLVSTENLDLERWNRTIDVNLKGPFLCAKIFIPIMKRRKYGRIVNVSSEAARCGGLMDDVAYVAAKAGIIGLTKQLALELGPFGITCNCVAPGMILTERATLVLNTRVGTDERKAFEQSIPVRHFGTTKEISCAILFLASEAASFITGVTLDVNGGRVFT